MHKAYKAILLLELLISLTIITIIIIISCNSARKHNREVAISQLQTLNYLLHLTRSEAIKLATQTYLCPTIDQKLCYYNWNAPIMIFTIAPAVGVKVLHFIRRPFRYAINNLIRFKFFGDQQEQKITFLPNGLTINNGHVCSDLNNLYCLYINHAGKTYLKIAEDPT